MTLTYLDSTGINYNNVVMPPVLTGYIGISNSQYRVSDTELLSAPRPLFNIIDVRCSYFKLPAYSNNEIHSMGQLLSVVDTLNSNVNNLDSSFSYHVDYYEDTYNNLILETQDRTATAYESIEAKINDTITTLSNDISYMQTVAMAEINDLDRRITALEN